MWMVALHLKILENKKVEFIFEALGVCVWDVSTSSLMPSRIQEDKKEVAMAKLVGINCDLIVMCEDLFQ